MGDSNQSEFDVGDVWGSAFIHSSTGHGDFHEAPSPRGEDAQLGESDIGFFSEHAHDSLDESPCLEGQEGLDSAHYASHCPTSMRGVEHAEQYRNSQPGHAGGSTLSGGAEGPQTGMEIPMAPAAADARQAVENAALGAPQHTGARGVGGQSRGRARRAMPKPECPEPCERHGQSGSAVDPPEDAADYMLTGDDQTLLDTTGGISPSAYSGGLPIPGGCSCCKRMSRDTWLAKVKSIINDNKVLFYRCGRDGKWECWAMNWRGPKLRAAWGKFQMLSEVRSGFRQKPAFKAVMRCPNVYYEDDGNKRPPGSSGEERVTKKHAAAAQGPHIPPSPAAGALGSCGAALSGDDGVEPGQQAPAPAVHQSPHRRSQPPLPGSAHAALGSEGQASACLLRFREVLEQFPWTGALLYFFFETEKENLDPSRFQKWEKLIQLFIQPGLGEDKQRRLIDTVKMLLPCDVQIAGNKQKTLHTVIEVLQHSFKLLGKSAEVTPKEWDDANVWVELWDDVEKVETIFKTMSWDVTHVIPHKSFGVFFRMPSWVAELVLFVLEHNVLVKDQLMLQGYRAFGLFTRGSDSTSFSDVEGDIPKGFSSVICAYNDGDCPAWAQPSGWSFWGDGISQQQRDFVQKLAVEYHRRDALLAESVDGVADASLPEVPKAEAGAKQDDYRLRRDELLEREKKDMPRAAAAGARGEAGAADSGGKLHTPTVRQHTYSAAQVGAAVTGAAEAVEAASERLRLWKKLDQVSSTCRQSDTRARDLLDPETLALIGRKIATTKGRDGASTRSGTSTTRGVSSGRETKDEELQMVKQVLAELHDFSGADGVDTSDWVLQVTVKQHDGKDDDKGERIESPKECGADYRLYTVSAQQLIKVTIKNLSAKPLSFQPVYVGTEGNEEPEEFTAPLKQGEERELPYPLEKADGETEDAWALKDGKGVIVLKLRFQVQRK